MITRRTFGQTALAGGLLAQAKPRPNVVFFCSDQHIGAVLGANGHPVVKTPNLDRLARLGVNFCNTYTNSPLCAPARAALASGQFPSDVGSYCNATAFDGRAPSWSNLLHDAGWHCWASGKLDTAQGVDYGFEEVKTSHGHSESPDIACLLRAPVTFTPSARERVDATFADEEHGDTALVDRALGFLREKAPGLGKPWAVFIGAHAPHPKWRTKRKYLDIYPPEKMPLPSIPDGYFETQHPFFRVYANYRNCSVPIPQTRIRRVRSAYYGMLTELDAQVGRVLDHLERSGELTNTIFIYTSDHGEMLGEHGLWTKNQLLEYSARVPLLIAGPGMPHGRTIETPVSHVDLIATLLDLTGVKPKSKLRGHSLAPMANGAAGTHPGFAYSETHSDGNYTGAFMIRKGDWKYIYFSGDRPLLFDLKRDPGEFHDLAGKPETATIQKELHAALTSLVDPDAVTRQAFDAQARRLDALVREKTKQEFYDFVLDRLGPGQSWALTERLYARRPVR